VAVAGSAPFRDEEMHSKKTLLGTVARLKFCSGMGRKKARKTMTTLMQGHYRLLLMER